MSSNYKSLSTYLTTSFNDGNNLIEEGVSDWISGFFGKTEKAPTKEQANKATGFFGFFKSIMTPKASEDKFMKAMNEMAATEAKNEEKRIKDELDAENDLEIARMKAEFEHNQNQLSIKSQNKIKAIRAYERQLKDAKDRAKNNRLLYTQEQSDAMIREFRQIGKDITAASDSPFKKMEDLAMVICINEDGSTRSQADIAKLIDPDNDKYDKKLADQVAEYNKLAETHGKHIISAMNSDEFKAAFKAANNEVLNNENLEQQLADAEEDLKNYEAGIEAIATRKKMKEEYDKAKEEADKANDELDALIGKDKNPFAKGYKEGDGNKGTVEQLSKDELIAALQGIKNNNDLKTTEGNIDVAKLKKYLKDNGLKDAEKLFDNKGEDGKSISELTPDAFGNIVDDISDEDAEKIAKSAKSAIETKIQAAKNKASLKQSELDKQINVDEASPEEIDAFIEKKYEGDPEAVDKLKSQMKRYNDMSEAGSIKNGDYDTEANQPGAKHLQDKKAAVESAKKAIEANKEHMAANKMAREHAASNMQFREDNDIPAEIRDKVEKKVDGIEAGEIICTDGENKGKIGFYIKDKDGNEEFVPKPGPGSSAEEQNKYIEQRNIHALTSDVTKLKQEVKSVKKNENDTYTIVLVDPDTGKEVTYDDITEDDAVTFKAQQVSTARQKGEILSAKQQLADDLKTFIKDGELDMEAVKKDMKTWMSYKDSEDPEKRAQYERYLSIKYALENPDKLDSIFKGIDAGAGNNTLNSIKSILKKDGKKDGEDISKELADIIKDEDSLEKHDVTKNSDDWEDDEDKDADEDDETDGDEEDEENAENSEGKKLVKKDGKWYKESDLDEEGNPKSDAQPQENVSKKKIKNPAKEWKKKKRKSGNGTTKNYYNKDGESISAKEYKQRMETYKKAKAKGKVTEQKYSQLRNYLIEMFG